MASTEKAQLRFVVFHQIDDLVILGQITAAAVIGVNHRKNAGVPPFSAAILKI